MQTVLYLRPDRCSYAFHTQSEAVRPWIAGSRFYILNDELNRWLDTLPSELAFTLNNLYTRQANSELGSLVGLHLLFDLVRLSLLRIGFSTPPEYPIDAAFKDAPPDFIKSCRTEAYRTGLTIRDRLKDVEKYFPDYISTSRLWTRSVHASLRIQIEHFVMVDPDVSRDPEMVAGFRTLVRMISKMTKYFSAERRFVSHLPMVAIDRTLRFVTSLLCSLNTASISLARWMAMQCTLPCRMAQLKTKNCASDYSSRLAQHTTTFWRAVRPWTSPYRYPVDAAFFATPRYFRHGRWWSDQSGSGECELLVITSSS